MENGKPIREALQSIAFECRESGATQWQILRVLKELENFEGTAQQLKKKAADILEKLNPEAAKTFSSFEKMRVYTSAERLEPFDRGNIIKSLLKETNISRHVAEKIGSEVEDKVKDLDLEYLNTHIIREMVSVKLLEYGHEPVHSQYARIGIPVFEARKKIAGGFDNPEILREYNWLFGIEPPARKLHFEGFISIFAPEDFSTKLFCGAKFFSGDPLDCALSAAKLDKICSVPATAKAINFSIHSAKLQRKKLAQHGVTLQKAFAITLKKRVGEIALYSENEWSANATKGTAVEFGNALLQSELMGIEPVVCIDSKFEIKLVRNIRTLGKISLANNSKEKVSAFPFGTLPGSGYGLQAVGFNLEKILESSLSRETYYFEKITEIAQMVSKLCEDKQQILAGRIDKKVLEGAANIAFVAGLANASIALDPDNPHKIAERTIALLTEANLCAAHMNEQESAQRFFVNDEKNSMQKILLASNSKTRRSYSFTYTCSGVKQAEQLLSDCPMVEIVQEKEQAEK